MKLCIKNPKEESKPIARFITTYSKHFNQVKTTLCKYRRFIFSYWQTYGTGAQLASCYLQREETGISPKNGNQMDFWPSRTCLYWPERWNLLQTFSLIPLIHFCFLLIIVSPFPHLSLSKYLYYYLSNNKYNNSFDSVKKWKKLLFN